jgi:hypothetical protein
MSFMERTTPRKLHCLAHRRADRRYRSAFVVTALLLGATGCANLKAIREFADISAESVRYQGLVRDYVSSPERLAQYEPGHCTSCARDSADRKKQEAALLLRQVVLQAYMDALGNLAADEVVDYSKEYGNLAAAAVNAKFVGQQDAASLNAIASVITKATTDAWRQKKLRELIEDTNSSVQTVIQAMQQVMQAFAKDVNNEETAATFYYRDLRKRSHDPAGIAASEEWARLRRSEIDSRRQAIATYSTVLNKIGEGHQHLYDDRNNLASRANLEQMQAYAQELKKAYKALQDLRS